MAEAKSSRSGSEKLKDGARFLLLDVPEETEIGIDYNSWNVGPNFRGIKSIPPGIHFIYYSAVNRDRQAAPRTGFFYNFQPREIVVRKWDARLEDVVNPVVSEDDVQRYRSNLREVDRYLGVYPYENYKKWVSLTSHMTPRVVGLLQPTNGKVSSVTEFISERSTSQSRREAAEAAGGKADTDKDGLPNMLQSADTIINYSSIPQHCHPKGATPAEITHCGMDSSFALESIIAERYSIGSHSQESGEAKGENSPRGDNSSKGDDCDGEGLLGELQFAFVCFLLGQNYDSFEQWKKCLRLMCSSGDSLLHRPKLFIKMVGVLHFQLREVPSDLFVDIVEGNNFLTQTLGEFFSRVEEKNVDVELQTRSLAFRHHLTRKFGWDFVEPDDCAPVVVDIGD